MHFRIVILLVFLYSSCSLWAQVKPSADGLYKEGLAAMHQRNYDLALDKFNRLISTHPGFDEAYFYRASTKMQLADLEGALTDYNIYLEWHPDNPEALFPASILNFNLERYAQAKKGFLRLKSMPGGETNTIFFRQARYGQGVDKVFTTQSPDQSGIYNYLGLIEKGEGSLENAIIYFDSAIHNNSNEPDYYVNRGTVYQVMGNLRLAESDYMRALQMAPDHSLAKNNLAILLELSGQEKMAEKYYTEAIADNPVSPYPYRQRAYKRMMSGNWEGALFDFNRAIALAPEEPETWLNRGIVYDKMNRFDEALEDYSEAISLQPNLAKAYLNRGNLLYKLQDYSNAINDYEVALMYAPDYGLAYYHRGITHHQLHNDDAACRDLREAGRRRVAQAEKALKIICKGP